MCSAASLCRRFIFDVPYLRTSGRHWLGKQLKAERLTVKLSCPSSSTSTTGGSSTTLSSSSSSSTTSGPVPPKFDKGDFQSPTIEGDRHRYQILSWQAGPAGVLPTQRQVSLLQLCPGISQLSGQAEAVLRHRLVEDDCWRRHEVWKMQEALHDARHSLRRHPPFFRADETRVRDEQGKWKPHFTAAIASVGLDGGSSGALCQRRGPGAVPPDEGQVHRPLGQGIY